MDKNIQPVPMIYSQSSISFPLDENTFRDFMVSLLGQPESIEGKLEGSFEIQMGDVEYLNNCIESKIGLNNSSLLEFRAKLFFDDESSMSFNGFHNFLQYSESRPLICEGFIFTWTYLVEFKNKYAPEKQEISVYSTKGDDFLTKKSENLDSKWNRIEMPSIKYSVRCTNKQWGIEIVDLIRRCSSRFIKLNLDNSPLTYIRRKLIEHFELLVLFLIFIYICPFFFLYLQELNTCQSLSSNWGDYIKSDFSVDQKINFLIQIISKCGLQKPIDLNSITTTVISIIGFVVFSVIIYKLVEFPNYRFILFTEKSKLSRDTYFRKLSERKNYLISGVLISLVIGVLGNYIFTWLSSIFQSTPLLPKK